MIKKRWLIVTVYVITLILLYADHNLLAPNLTRISEELGMTLNERDVKLGGHISLAFYAVGVPSTFLFGWLTDSLEHRSILFGVVVIISESACLATYFVQSFEMLLFARSITGIGIGGSLPIVYSILGDLFQADGRNISSAVISTALGLGLGIGQGLAGFLGPTYGWRLPFLLVSIPTFLFAGICCFLEDPERGSKETTIILARSRLNQANYNVDDSRDVEHCDGIDQVRNNTNDSQCEIDDADKPLNSMTNNKSRSMVKVRNHVDLNLNTTCNVPRTYEMYPVEQVSLKSTCRLLSTPTVILLLIQGAPSVIPFGITSTFLNDYLAQDKGLAVEVRRMELELFLFSYYYRIFHIQI